MVGLHQDRSLQPLRPLPDMPSDWSDDDLEFDEAAQRIIDAHRADGVGRDLPIPDLRTWGVVPLDGTVGLAPLGLHHPPRPLRSTGLTNLCNRLSAPVDFVRDRLPAPLQLATLNYLLTIQEKPLATALRLRGDDIAAVVSDRYASMDQEELLGSVRDALIKHDALGRVRVRAYATGMTDVLRLVFANDTAAVKVGDVTALGIDVSTSSFGRSAIHVSSLLWRLACTNGLRTPSSMGRFSFRHVGDVQRLRDGISEAIPAALVHANGVMDRWKAAVGVMVEDVQKFVDGLRGVTTAERDVLQQELKNEVGAPELPEHMPLYDLVNGFTAMARQAQPSRRLELEDMAGNLLFQRTA